MRALTSIFGGIISVAVYFGAGAIAHHLLVGPFFDPYRMMSWGVVLGWPFIFGYVMTLCGLVISGVVLFIIGLSDKEHAITALGAGFVVFGGVGWKLFF